MGSASKAYGPTGLFSPAVVDNAIASSAPLLMRIVPVLLLVFGLLFLASLFIAGQWLVRHLGRAGGGGGWALTVACGMLAAGPLYARFPLLSELKTKGMSGTLIPPWPRAQAAAAAPDGALFRHRLHGRAVTLHHRVLRVERPVHQRDLRRCARGQPVGLRITVRDDDIQAVGKRSCR